MRKSIHGTKEKEREYVQQHAELTKRRSKTSVTILTPRRLRFQPKTPPTIFTVLPSSSGLRCTLGLGNSEPGWPQRRKQSKATTTNTTRFFREHTLTAAPLYSGLRKTPPNCRAVWCMSARVSFLRSTERRAAHLGHHVCNKKKDTPTLADKCNFIRPSRPLVHTALSISKRR